MSRSPLQHSKAELRAAGLFDDDSDYNGDIGVQVSALMETFCAYGHSGGSAETTLAAFTRLAAHKPLTPLTGEDDEWEMFDGPLAHPDVNGPVLVNIRYPKVLKDKDRAWDTNNYNRPVEFPYTVQ